MPFNPNHVEGEGGGKWPAANRNNYSSATECLIDLKPCCIFKFVHCLNVLEGLLSTRVPENQPCRVNLRVHLGVYEGP